MGRQVVETVLFDGYGGQIGTTIDGVDLWTGLPPEKISGPSCWMRLGVNAVYLLPRTALSGCKILGGEIRVNGHAETQFEHNTVDVSYAPLAEKMTASALSGASNPPAISNKYVVTWEHIDTFYGYEYVGQKITQVEECLRVLQNGFRIATEATTGDAFPAFFYDTVAENGTPMGPRFLVEVEYAAPEIWGFGPSGWIDVHKDNRFFWSIRYDSSDVIGSVSQSSASFQWKDGENGAVHEVILGAQNEYVVPANTFPKSGNLLWRVVVTANNGEVAENMDWTKLSAFDSIPVLKPITPVGEYIEARGSVRFAWSYSIETGSKQTAYEVQIKSDSMDWKTIASGQGAASEILVGAELIPAGTLQWRVRGANFDGVFSDWTTPATFVAIAAPTMPSLRVVEATPRPVIAWQGAGQQGYEAEIGDYYSGVVYGTQKEAKSSIYLPDGTVRARVRIVNEFGLWSEWAEIEFQVSNEPIAGNIVLTTRGGVDATLSWNVLADVDAYLIYRNGKLIGTTKNGTYKDRLFLGTADYFVRAVQDGSDFYVDSNASTAETKTEHVLISKYGGEWIDLEYSLTATPSVQTTTNSEVTLMRYMGRTYPMPEYSPQKSRLYKLNVAFKDMLEAAAFEALLGELVVVKDQYGNFVVGVMESVQKTQTAFFTSFSTTISQVDEAAYYEET